MIFAHHSWGILIHFWSSSPLAALSNEPLWLMMNAGLKTVLPAESVLRTLIFMPATLVAWLVLRYDPRQFLWLLVFLLLPQVLKNHIVHLRQGTAISVFLAGWFTSRQPLRWLLIGATPFIHSAFFFVLGLMALSGLARRMRLAAYLRTLLFVSAGVAISLSLAWIASLLGARQAQHYDFSMPEVSGLGFVFWIIVFGVMWQQGRMYVYRHAFELGVIAFYLATYFLIEVTARIFESALLLVLFAGLRLTRWRRVAFLSLITSYGFLQYLMNIGQPWLGFG
jgi:hypothetical protein